jgi:serine/threonine-protein kinase
VVHGRYTVVRKLAEGGMAEIFLARQHGSEGFEKPVVLKRIHSAFYADEQFRNMLVDEAHISMGLHHNNIVQVLDLGRAGGRLFLVLELVDGWDLARVLERAATSQTPLPPGLGLYIIAEVCRALSYAHSRTRTDGEPMAIVHRDVSPQNVLISEQGEVKLADFGIAKALTRQERTATGVVKGKIAFMSPEQAHGQALDARSDLFSLGTLLYLVTTGVRPFEAATDFEVIARVQKCLYRPPEQVSPGMPESLGAVIRRAMTLDRDHRYRTADELLVDLESVWRAEYGAPGQTELKLWLADLGKVDGGVPLGRTGVFAAGRNGGPGDLAEGAALVLGDEGSDRGRSPHLSVGDTAVAELRLPEIGALEASLPDSATRSERHGGRRRVGARPVVSGVEATTMSDLSLPVHDDSQEINRMRSRSRRRMVGTSFLVFALMGGGVAVGLWRLSVHRRGGPEGAAEGNPTPVAAPVAPAPRPVVAAPPAPARRSSAARGEGRPELPRSETREPLRPPPARIEPPQLQPSAATEAAAAAAAAREQEREQEREEERRRARERRWALPSGASDLPTPPSPTEPAPVQPGESTVAPPPVNEILPPTEETQPARETQPETPPSEEPTPDPKKQIPPLDPPPRQEPPAQSGEEGAARPLPRALSPGP